MKQVEKARDKNEYVEGRHGGWDWQEK